jgi:hypothetical protein
VTNSIELKDEDVWIWTVSSRKIHLLRPTRDEIWFPDIATALSHVCRFGGQLKQHYSVAQHCVVMSRLVTPEAAVWALMHDSAEGYLGDVVYPLKHSIPVYRDIEDRMLEAIAGRLGMSWPIDEKVKAEVKAWDAALCRHELQKFTGRTELVRTAMEGVTVTAPPDCIDSAWGPERACRLYLARAVELGVFVCTHPGAKWVCEWPGGQLVGMRCPDCGKLWEAEPPSQ